MISNFTPDPWMVRKNGRCYKALGYERRGVFNIPIADFLGGVPIQCTVYEIVHSMIPKNPDAYYSVSDPNNVELVLLEESGWNFDGCFVHYVG